MQTTCLVFFAFSLLTAPAVRGAGNEGELFKQIVYSQFSSAGSSLAIPTPYGIRATVRNSVTNQTQSLTIPSSSGWVPQVISITNLAGGHFVFDQRFPAQSALDAAFTVGSYEWIWYRPHTSPTTIDQLIDLDAAAVYPTSCPSIIGALWRDGYLRCNPNSFDLTWNQWISPPGSGDVSFELWGEGGSGGGSSSAASTSLVWGVPLSANKIYDMWLSFRVNQHSFTITDANAPSNQSLGFKSGVARTVYFQVSTFPLAAEPPSPPEVALVDAKPMINWPSFTGNTYQLQKSTDLAGWQNVGSVLTGTGYPLRYKATTAVSTPTFYRLLITMPPPNTLFILTAKYGANSTFADVKSFVESKVVNSAINMQVTNSNLGGDPLPGVTKYLTVEYQDPSGTHSKTVREGLYFVAP